MTKLIEVIGVAGAGKTTITGNINRYFPDWNTNFTLPRWKFALYVLINLLRYWVPLLRFSEPGQRGVNLKLLAHMDAMVSNISNRHREEILFFDQGIIFAYASLITNSFKRLPQQQKDSIYQRVMIRYFTCLDFAIFLEADKDILSQRVLSRTTPHRLKSFSESEVEDFFRDYERVFAQLKQSLVGHGCKVVEIDSSTKSIDEVWAEFLHWQQNVNVNV